MFKDLSEREVLALAISNEEEDGRTYVDFAKSIRETYPDSARLFDDMAAEENGHRRALIDLFRDALRRSHPGHTQARHQGARRYPKPAWQIVPKGIHAIRRQARQMEADASRFLPAGGGACR